MDGHPAMGEALVVSGLSHMLLREYENAAGLLKLVMERYPGYPKLADVSYSLATSYYYGGQYRNAVESYEHFLKRWPDNRGTSAARTRLIKSYKWLYRQGAMSREEALKTTEQIYQELAKQRPNQPSSQRQ
jgi:outer membrane protein assembly factor BamD (BamD/ComL family)